MITVTINQEQHQFEEQTSLQTVLSNMQISLRGLAVAINNSVISQADWETTIVKQDDKIILIKATQGG